MSTPVQKSPFHRSPALHVPVALLLVTTAACVPEAGIDADIDAEPDPSWTSGLDDVDLSPIAPTSDQWNSCPTWDCNKNHPMLTGFPVPEVNEDGLLDDHGLSLQSFRQGLQLLRLDVDRGEIKGYDPADTLVLDGAGAIGSILTIGNATTTWRIRIDDFARIPYWTGPLAAVPAYRLLYQKVGATTSIWTNVCKAPENVILDPEWQGGHETYALLISDERYDRDAKRVRDDGNADGWFNIACAGTALAKMVLMRFDPHIPATDLDYYTIPTRRTTTLKMLTADYLGFGEAFTQGGLPMQWADSLGWHPELAPNVSEAVWDENGAVCLDTPRLDGIESDMLKKIEDVCNATPGCTMPPTCSAQGVTPLNWTQYGPWRTWNP
jgi:ADYC domain